VCGENVDEELFWEGWREGGREGEGGRAYLSRPLLVGYSRSASAWIHTN